MSKTTITTGLSTKPSLTYPELRMMKLKDRQLFIKFCVTALFNKGISEHKGKRISTYKDIEIIQFYDIYFEIKAKQLFNEQLKNRTHRRKIMSSNIENKKSLINGLVYVIGNKEFKLCKIGFSTDINKRIKSLQTGCPFKIEILAIITGSYEIEKQLHLKYKKYNTTGEWFRIEEDLEIDLNNFENDLLKNRVNNDKKSG